ncbi:MAG: SDR family NAD(P)-dependent oxidoreductase [Desulforhopalus sp.]|jgi:short-subunit dehydrogenase|nr:SDR family NAD(P)-dependent oxidoreductase [Desulforhopalus sp.]
MKILVTGATSGIGRQLAVDYHHEGHEVWAIGRNPEALTELGGQGLHTAALDLTDRETSLAWFATLDSLDLAILNAGTCEYVDMPEFDSALVARVMRANVESLAISIEGVLPLLRRGNRPHLVGVGSSAAYLPLPRAEAYGASKAAVAYMLDTLRLALVREKIFVSLVCPGFVQTPLTDRNDFPMPFRVTTETASMAIRRGIDRRQMEIHFPKRFTYLLKILSLLPRALWCRLAQKMRRN